MDSIYFEITDGSVSVGVTVTTLSDGTLKFDLSVLGDTGVIGDLNGLFFDLADDSIASDIAVSGVDLTGDNIAANKVSKVDGWNNVNGDVVNEDGKFDVGVQFGTSGMAKDDIQDTSFVMSRKSGEALSIDDVLGQDFAVRLTSVGEIDGAREDSVKISGTSDPIEPEPTPDPEPEPQLGNIAFDDSMTVSNMETFSEFGLTDPLDEFQFSMLDNDLTSDAAPYAGVVTAANGQDWIDGLIVQGSNGGLLLVFANGTVDFSANGEFDHLGAEDTATTQFQYAIEGGSTAFLDVLIFSGGGSGGEFPDATF